MDVPADHHVQDPAGKGKRLNILVVEIPINIRLTVEPPGRQEGESTHQKKLKTKACPVWMGDELIGQRPLFRDPDLQDH